MVKGKEAKISKIEEMAEKAFPTKSWEEERSAYWCRKIYCMGANAVLKEIENILSLEYNTMATVDLIVEKVKELKG